MNQSRLSSAIEAVFNVIIGFTINFSANAAVFPLFGWHISPSQNFALGAIYTPISLVQWRDGDRSAGFIYWCQGCESHHMLRTESSQGAAVWGFNGNLDKPTFTPSVLVTIPAVPDADPIEFPEYLTDRRCHTFITDGMVQFLSDCTHELTGQTLPLPDLPRSERDDA